MRVIIVNVNSHIGSTGKISYGLYQYLKQKGNDVKLCCRGVKEPSIQDDNIIELNSKWELYYSIFMSRLTGYEGIHNRFATARFFKLLDEFKPDVVHLFNLPGYYLNYYNVMEFLKNNEIPTVYSMMDEFNYTGKCTYPGDCTRFMTECHHCPQKKGYPQSWFFDNSNKIFKRKKKIYEGWDLLTLTGIKWSCDKAKKSALTCNTRLEVIPHPINTKSLFTPRDASGLRQKLRIPENNKVVLTATDAKAERKGGKFFLEMAKKMENDKGFTFVFVGYNRDDWEIPNNMITVGFVSDQNMLAEFYSLADLYVCVSLADTFPTTCLNALACGTKLLGFEAGGVPYCAPKEFGKYVPARDVDALVSQVKKMEKKTERDIKETREFACASYSEEVVNAKFYNLYKSYFDK